MSFKRLKSEHNEIMHNTIQSDSNQNTDTEHFPNTTANLTETNTNTNDINNNDDNGGDSSSNSERAQKFSFSTAYTSRHYNNNANGINSNKYNSLAHNNSNNNLHYSPISAFTIVNEDTSYIGKPNAIVRPIRRSDQSQGLPRPVPEYDSNAGNTRQQQHQQQQPFQRLEVSNLSVAQTSQNGQQTRNFMDELNRKLRFLSNKENLGSPTKSRNSSLQNAGNQESLSRRPLFITTVPTGVFLPPPKELPLPPSLQRRVYAFSSHPFIFSSDYYRQYSPTNNGHSRNKRSLSPPPPHPPSLLSKDKTTIVGSDKKSTTAIPTKAGNNSTTHMNDIQGYLPELTVTGGVHLTKQQFQQQIRERRAKRETPVEPYKNVMYDRRIIRGSNFGNTLLEESDPFDKAAELRRRNALRKKATCRNQRNVLGTPPPVAGRKHEVIQTEKYLEELLERPPEFNEETQTDLFLERPPMPPYVPAKVGIDVGTEIADGELFHFEAEAQPIIDVLVDACIEQSMLEVAHQQEIEALRRKQEEYMTQREAELAELRRLEAEELRLQAEKERRLRQDEIAKSLDAEMQRGVTAAKLLQGHIAGLLPEVLENLEPATDAAKKEQLMKTICPWLSVEVAEEVGQIVDSREILTVIIQEIIKQRAEIYAGYKEEVPPEQLTVSAICEYEEEGACDPEPECGTCDTDSSEDCPPVPEVDPKAGAEAERQKQ